MWRYRLEPAGDGTDVTESFELADQRWLRLYWALLGWARGRTNRNGMRTTLERIKAEVESASGPVASSEKSGSLPRVRSRDPSVPPTPPDGRGR